MGKRIFVGGRKSYLVEELPDKFKHLAPPDKKPAKPAPKSK